MMKKLLMLFGLVLLAGGAFYAFQQRESMVEDATRELQKNNEIGKADTAEEKKKDIKAEIIVDKSEEKQEKVIEKESITQEEETELQKNKEAILQIMELNSLERGEYDELTIRINYTDQQRPSFQNNDSVFLNIDGVVKNISGSDGQYFIPILSPTKKYVVFNQLTKGVVLFNIENESKQYIAEGGSGTSWSSDGKKLLYIKSKGDGHVITQSNIYVFDVHKKIEKLINIDSSIKKISAVFSRNSNYIYFRDSETNKIYKVKL